MQTPIKAIPFFRIPCGFIGAIGFYTITHITRSRYRCHQCVQIKHRPQCVDMFFFFTVVFCIFVSEKKDLHFIHHLIKCRSFTYLVSLITSFSVSFFHNKTHIAVLSRRFRHTTQTVTFHRIRFLLLWRSRHL